MNEQGKIKISEYVPLVNELLKQTQDVLDDVGYESKRIPKETFDGEKPISLVFAGQYSAGKSTILKSLTGIESIETGAGITTQAAHTYLWNGLEVIDTPGIHTTLRPDHDEISYNAIVNADMLVYVVTQELFDSYIGEKFRELLIDGGKAGELILVVNKMADVGNTEDNRKIKLEALREVTTPYSPEELRTCFIDAKSYLDSYTQNDAEIRGILLKRSNMESFIATLNQFVNDRGMISRITTPLYKAKEILQSAMTEKAPSTGDADVDAVEESWRQERSILTATAHRIDVETKSIYQDVATQIRDKGRLLANQLYDFADEDEANQAIQNSENEVDQLSDQAIQDVVAAIENISKNGDQQLDDFYSSEFSKDLSFRLNEKKSKGNPVLEKLIKSDILGTQGQKLANSAIGNSGIESGLRAFSGSQAHEFVLNAGHFFGHNFKPWEAVKFAKAINGVGKALGVIGVVFSIGLQFKSDKDESERQNAMRANRERLRAGYNEVADAVAYHIAETVKKFISENYDTTVQSIDKKLENIQLLRKNKSDDYDKLLAMDESISNLIARIHQQG